MRQNNNIPYISTNNSTYTLASKFIFDGSSNVGTPTIINVQSRINSGSGQIRIFDVTNVEIIAENTSINTTTFTIFSLGTISNIPTGRSEWELQYNKGTSMQIDLDNISIMF